MLELQRGSGHQFGVSTHSHPGSAVVSLLLEIRHDLVAVGFGVQVVAHLDQESHVLIGAETRIQAELCFDRFRVGGILLLKTQQAIITNTY